MSSSQKQFSANIIEDFDKLLLRIVTKFSQLLIDNFDKEIEEALKLVAECLDVDQASLGEFTESEGTLHITHRYAKPQVAGPFIENISIHLPEFTKEFKNGNVIASPVSEELKQNSCIVSPELDNWPGNKYVLEKKYAIARKMKSAIGLSIKIGGEFRGLLILILYKEARIWTGELITKLTSLSEIFSNVLERKRSHERHQHILALGDLITSKWIDFLNLPHDHIDAQIKMAMQDFAVFLGVERAALYQSPDTDEKDAAILKILHYWCSDEDKPWPKEINLSNFPWSQNELLNGRIITISSLDEYPVNALTDRKRIADRGIKAILSIPLLISGRVDGVLSFSNVSAPKIWTPDVVSSAKIIAQVFSNILSRKKADQEIRRLKEKAETENILLKKEIALQHPHQDILGKSNAIKTVLGQVEIVAETDSSVLILGETGTGKDLIVNEIHRLSLRKDRSLIRVNCATLPGSLIEGELFGREKGAFTGAVSPQPGRFEIAGGSTIFLDEIGEMPLELQAKLLRVLQDGKFERLGSSKTIHVDVRVIAATNRNLEKEVEKNKFREDLYYRLKVFPIHVPPLRDRVEDIPALAYKFIDEFSAIMGKKVKHVPKRSIEMLKTYSWPGNVRELKNVIEHSMILHYGHTLSISLPENAEGVLPANLSLKEMERQNILRILKQTGWRVKGKKGAAEILNVKPSTLFSKMKKLDIHRENSVDAF